MLNPCEIRDPRAIQGSSLLLEAKMLVRDMFLDCLSKPGSIQGLLLRPKISQFPFHYQTKNMTSQTSLTLTRARWQSLASGHLGVHAAMHRGIFTMSRLLPQLSNASHPAAQGWERLTGGHVMRDWAGGREGVS